MNEIGYLIECTSRDLVLMLMERKNVSMKEAFKLLYTSECYQKLKDPNTGLYYQSPGYVYAILDRELKYGKLEP